MTNGLPSPSRLPLLLILLLAPGVALAAQEPPFPPEARAPVQRPLLAASGLPGTDERAPLRLSEEEWAREDSRPPRGLRILAEVGASALTGLGGGFGGFLAGGALCEAGVIGSNTGFLSCLNPAAVGLLLGTGTGLALGTWWGGELAGGDGKLLGAVGGVGVGVVVGLIAMVATRSFNALLIGFPVAAIGAVVGYELTQSAPASSAQAPAVASARPRFQPVLAFSSRGALVGLGGSF